LYNRNTDKDQIFIYFYNTTIRKLQRKCYVVSKRRKNPSILRPHIVMLKNADSSCPGFDIGVNLTASFLPSLIFSIHE
jgi:hypothetical protein